MARKYGLTGEDIGFILESLSYTRMKFENYKYPTYKMKRERLDDVNRVMAHVRAYRDQPEEEQE